MVKVTIASNVVVFKSEHTMDELTRVAKHKPRALMLSDEDGFVYFTVLPGTKGVVNDSGIVFDSTAEDGSASVLVSIPELNGRTQKKAVAEEFGSIIMNADKVDEQIKLALNELSGLMSGIESRISVI